MNVSEIPAETSVILRPYGIGVISKGFTLIELMIVLVIFGIVLVLAVPGFSSIFLSARLSNYATELVSTVYLARGEAIKRNAPVTLCASEDGVACSDTNDWGQGWIVLDTNDVVLKAHAEVASGFSITTTNNAHTMIFDGAGLVDGAVPPPYVFRICRGMPSVGHQERSVSINRIGKASVETTTNGSCN
jgi:type IV fimbrial biogenesis protein FimT